MARKSYDRAHKGRSYKHGNPKVNPWTRADKCRANETIREARERVARESDRRVERD